MRSLTLNYPHEPVTWRPGRLRAEQIRQLAWSARAQLCRRPSSPQVQLSDLLARLSAVVVNTRQHPVLWEMEGTVLDDAGKPVFGSTEADLDSGTVLVRLNAELIGERPELGRSTALHELGHVVFDAPAWFAGPAPVLQQASAYLRPHPLEAAGDDDLRWAEWRANEFMGSFLLPQACLHRELIKHATDKRLRLVCGTRSGDLPIVALDRFSFRFDDLVDGLGESFGLSPSFVAVRLRKYNLVHGERDLG